MKVFKITLQKNVHEVRFTHFNHFLFVLTILAYDQSVSNEIFSRIYGISFATAFFACLFPNLLKHFETFSTIFKESLLF